LREVGTLDNPFYLFVFTNEATDKQHKIVLENNAGVNSRCEEFELTLPDDLNLKPEGNYFVQVYEQTSPTNLNPDNATGLVHVGKCKLYLTATDEFYHTPTN